MMDLSILSYFNIIILYLDIIKQKNINKKYKKDLEEIKELSSYYKKSSFLFLFIISSNCGFFLSELVKSINWPYSANELL